MIKSALCFCAAFLFSQSTHAVTLLFEDFEDTAVNYSTSITEFSDSAFDYFGRIAPDGFSISSDVSFNNTQGNGFFAAMDTDADITTQDTGVLTFLVDISGFNNLQFSTMFAEDVADNNQPDWDTSTSFIAQYSIDGGPVQNLLAFESIGGTNTAAAQDTDFDGVGDGGLLTDTFTLYQADIIGTGDQLTLQFTLNFFDAGDEDIAFDNVLLAGDAIGSPVPVPAAFWLFASVMLGLIGFRKTTGTGSDS